MHLLHSNPLSGPEFVSLSLFMKPVRSNSSSSSSSGPGGVFGNSNSRMGEPMLLASPLSTVSHSDAIDAVKELHNYLNSLFRSFLLTKNLDLQSRMTAELIQEDDRLLQQMQIFRPSCGYGVGLHYRLIRDPSVTMQIASLILASSKSGQQLPANFNIRNIESEVVGVVFCVGLSGLPLAHSSSSLQYGLSQKINDCLGVLSRIGTYDVAAAKMLLSTLLLTEDEYRKSNEMAEAAVLTAIPEGVTEAAGWGAIFFQKREVVNETKGQEDIRVSLGESSADFAREMVERLRVLSVAESDTILKRYETSGLERKANLDLTGTKSRFRRKRDTNIADLERFDYEGPVKASLPTKVSTMQSSAPMLPSNPSASSSKTAHSLIRPKKGDTSLRSAPITAPKLPSASLALMGPRINRRASATGAPNRTGPQHDAMATPSVIGYDDPRRMGQNTLHTKRATMDLGYSGDGTASTANSSATPGDISQSNSSGGITRLQVNIALNEDLTCSYKASKMTSCNVEGVVQIQMKANTRSGVPFQILLRDPSRHVQSLQENKKYADDISHAQLSHDPQDRVDRRFTVSIPQTNNYFPVLRYKCSQELRPVPIRVQTRVKADRSHCRVALQISSNPHNDGSLTDLTIIMGVTTEIIGETLITQPAGGVWNASKRSVIWCVSELGDGEKFQLQAKFEMNPDIPYNPEVTPKFPVLVRCQCMFAQLSDIEVEVRDIPEVCPTEVTMKIARRFRLSHQERS